MPTKYFYKFDTLANYRKAKSNHLPPPNVCKVIDTGETYVNTLWTSIKYAEAGDIITYHVNGNGTIDVRCIKPEAFDKNDTYWKADSVVAVPNSHTKDGTLRAISLTYANLKDSRYGGEGDSLVWGNQGDSAQIDGVDVYADAIMYSDYAKQDDDETFGTAVRVYLPCDSMSITYKVDNPYDIGTTYYNGQTQSPSYAPSPYENDGSANPAYHSEGVFSNVVNNAFRDMDGYVNTSAVLKALDNKVLKQELLSATITNETTVVIDGTTYSLFPSACACAKYCSSLKPCRYNENLSIDENLKQGNLPWYLPSIGEIGYIIARVGRINYGIEQAGGVKLTKGTLWSSTCYTKIYGAWYMYNRGVGEIFATIRNQKKYVRPFVKFDLSAFTPFFCRLRTANGQIHEINGMGELTSNMIVHYKTDLVSAEIGPYCDAIGVNAFMNFTNLTSVIIPNSVTSIGDQAFYGCTGLTSVSVPNSVTSIGASVFQGCTNLVSVSLPNSITSIGDASFAQCSSLTSVTIPNSVTSIDSYAFGECTGLSEVTFPNTLESIGYSAFSGCEALAEITIPRGVLTIGETAFNTAENLTTVTFNSDYMAARTFQQQSNLKNYFPHVATLTIGSTGKIGQNAFYGCTTLQSLTIGESVTSIDNYAFTGCGNLANVTIGDGVTSVGQSAFQNCSNMTSLTMGNGITTIGSMAFSGCSGLTSVTIPNSTTSIGGSAFYNCSGLTSLTIGEGVTSVGNSAFGGLTSLTSLTALCATVGNWFSGHTALANVTIGKGVTSIAADAFKQCRALESITVDSANQVYDSRGNCNAIIQTATNTLMQGCMHTVIPNSVTTIGQSAFYNCTGLEGITIPNSVTSIGTDAFRLCSNLTSINLGNGVTTIGQSAFNSCGLTSVTFGNSVTTIGYQSFYGCRALPLVVIPSNVTTIGADAFRTCRALASVIILATTPPTLGGNAFNSNASGRKIYVPAESVEAYKAATNWSAYAADIEAITD